MTSNKLITQGMYLIYSETILEKLKMIESLLTIIISIINLKCIIRFLIKELRTGLELESLIYGGGAGGGHR